MHSVKYSSPAVGSLSHNRSVRSHIGISPPSMSLGAFVQIGSEYLAECFSRGNILDECKLIAEITCAYKCFNSN